jgi:RNA polymerase sigma-70 factor (ECF subfamily)
MNVRQYPQAAGQYGLFPAENLAEGALLQRARAGERAAFDKLFARHRKSVYVYLCRLMESDGEQVEEAVGAVFLSAFQALSCFRGEAAFATWLHSIAANEARRRRRRQDLLRRREAPLSLADEEDLLDGNAPGPEMRCILAEEDRVLTRAVYALPEPYRTPVLLHCVRGTPAAEIARQLNRPAGTVRYQVSQGLKILRERLERLRRE